MITEDQYQPALYAVYHIPEGKLLQAHPATESGLHKCNWLAKTMNEGVTGAPHKVEPLYRKIAPPVVTVSEEESIGAGGVGGEKLFGGNEK
jgi:hypothetical protein